MARTCRAAVGAWLLSALPRGWTAAPADCPTGFPQGAGEVDGPSLLQLPKRVPALALQPGNWSQRVCFKEGAATASSSGSDIGDSAVLLLTGFQGDERGLNLHLELEDGSERGGWRLGLGHSLKVWKESAAGDAVAEFAPINTNKVMGLAEPTVLELQLADWVPGVPSHFTQWQVRVNGAGMRGWEIPDLPIAFADLPTALPGTSRVKCIRASGSLRSDSQLAINDHAITQQPADGPQDWWRQLTLQERPQDGDGFELAVQGLGTNGYVIMQLGSGSEAASSETKGALTTWRFGFTELKVQDIRGMGVPALELFASQDEPARQSSLKVVLAEDTWQVSINGVRRPQFDVPEKVLDGPPTMIQVAVVHARHFDVTPLGQASAPQPLPTFAPVLVRGRRRLI